MNQNMPSEMGMHSEAGVHVKIASPGKRLLAAIIDVILVSVPLTIVRGLLFDDIFATESQIFWFAASWIYYVGLTGMYGQTVGKMALRIKVIKRDGSTPDYGVAALREIIGKLVSGIVLSLGFIWILFDKNREGWHDKIATTWVVEVE